MKKQLIVFAAVTISVFIVSFFVSDNLGAFERALASVIFGLFGMLAFCVNGAKTNKISTANKKTMPKSKAIYVFPYNKKQFKYRVDNGYVYAGMSNRFAYRIDKDKVYERMSASPLLYIEGNRVYNYNGNKNVIYRIDGNLIYQASFLAFLNMS